MKRTNILIVGLGLIGGSLAKAIKQNKEHYVIGYDVDEETLNYALNNNIIDEKTTSIEKYAKEIDIIILAAPISITVKYIKILNEITFNKEVIVTDTCSVKASIMEAAKQITNDKLVFIGGHPMAGSHKNGVQAAKAHLFENAIYILSPFEDCSNQDLNKLKTILAPTKSRFVILEPEEHDEMTGVISHFPHLIASSLVHQAKKWERKHHFLQELAAGGFRDITRIASSNPKLWQDIFYHNEKRMSRLLTEWIDEMEHLKNILQEKRTENVISYLQEAKEYRDGLRERKRGALPSFYDFYVDIKDKPGALAQLLDLLAKKKINITNIRILEIREGITGAVRISVTTEEEQLKAVQLLNDANYETTIEP